MEAFPHSRHQPIEAEIVRGGSIEAPEADHYSDLPMWRLVQKMERMAQIGCWRYDLRRKTVYWSPEVYAIHEIDPAGKVDLAKALEFFPQPGRALLEASIERAAMEGEPYDLELDFVAASGTHKRVRAMGEPETGADGTLALIGIFQDITERYRLERELREAAATDPLTRAYNRRQLHQHYRQMRYAERAPGKLGFAIAIIDLDHFKQLNDTHGHAVGDRTLKAFAERLRAPWLNGSFLARLGGDEFVLILDDRDVMSDLKGTVARLLRELALPIDGPKGSIPLSATIGVACFDDSGVPLDQALKCADTSLYIAKRKARGSATIAAAADLFLSLPPGEQKAA